MIYRVIIEVGYHKAFFDFDTPSYATSWATTALEAANGCDDTDRPTKIILEIINEEVTKDDE